MARLRIIASGVLVAALMSGCTARDGSAPAGPPALGAVPTITEAGQVGLPTDPYLVTPAQNRLLVQARDAVTAECMRGFGFAGRPTTVLGEEEAERARRTRGTLYGYFDTDRAGARGYDLNVRFANQSAPADTRPPASAAEQIALSGIDPATRQAVPSLDGRPVPPGGCARQGLDAFHDADGLAYGEGAMPDGGPKVPADDPRITAAYAAWSRCMKDEGYDYPDPVAAISDPKWHPPADNPATAEARAAAGPAPEEIATATADLRCKLAGNTVGTIVAVQTAYGKRYVEAHAAQLADQRQRLDDLVRRAAGLVSGATGGSTGGVAGSTGSATSSTNH
ncbi:hypothetical protein [Kitasatospora sp. SUK 42]|uniref:hypothetical protein n=1 Tax=Kitasatospora sp. SUK 42 TaxID=1588882 RepID=UPI0018CAF230|nr:hypothetical protein [Kitasatospora sp. SUK 42]MBV2152681.1 hypothetical protein [Kitasatospora sp. SUK 42]